MNAYIILILCILFLWVVTKKGKILYKIGKAKSKGTDFFTMLSFFVVFLLSALRNETVGVDTGTYTRYYNTIGQLSWKGLINGEWDHNYFTTEKGYMILEKVCNDLLIPTQLFIALCAGLFLYGVYRLVESYTENSALLAVLSFLAVGSYLLSINVLRQGIGVGLCCMAWVELKKGNKKHFIAEVLLACTFHVSSCVFFLAILFEIIPASKKSAVFATIGLIAFGFGGAALLPIVLRWFPIYAARYGNGRWIINEANGIIIVWALVIMIVIALAFRKDWNKKENHVDYEIMLFSLCYVCINIIGLSFDGAQRLSMLFQPFLILLFDRSCGLWKGRTKHIYTLGVIAGMLLLFIRASSTAQYVYLPFWA